MNGNTRFDPKTDFRSEFPRFSPENLAANMPVVELLKRLCREEERNALASGARMAAGAEAVHCADSRHTQHRSPQRESRWHQRRADALRTYATSRRRSPKSRSMANACPRSTWGRLTGRSSISPWNRVGRPTCLWRDHFVIAPQCPQHRTSVLGPSLPCHLRRAVSAIGGSAEDICSH